MDKQVVSQKEKYVHAALKESGGADHVMVSMAPVTINIQVLDCRTGSPVRGAVVNYLTVGQGNDNVYVRNGERTSALDRIMNLTGPGMGQVQQKVGKTVKTDVNGFVHIPLPITKFGGDFEIKIGLKKFAVLAESFPSGKGIYRNKPSGPTGFRFTYKDKNHTQPDPGKDPYSEESWGWSVGKHPGPPATPAGIWLKELVETSVLKGNAPASKFPVDFKLVETFKIKQVDFGNIHPDIYSGSTNKPEGPNVSRQLRHVKDWDTETFNAFATGFGHVENSFSQMTHFVVFALTWYKGIDIYSGTFGYLKEDKDWDLVKSYGIDFIQIKLSEGFGADGHTNDHAAKARARGFKIGYYHWPHPEIALPQLDASGKTIPDPKKKGASLMTNKVRTGRAEAEYVIKNFLTGLPEPDLPFMVDLETLIGTMRQAVNKKTGELMWKMKKVKDADGKVSYVKTDKPEMEDVTTAEQKEMNRVWVLEFLDTLKSTWPWKVFRQPIIYGFYPYLHYRLPDTDNLGLGSYPLSLAHYPWDVGDPLNKINIENRLEAMIPGTMKSGSLIQKNWKMWAIWQASGFGHIPQIHDSDISSYQFDKDYVIDTSIFE